MKRAAAILFLLAEILVALVVLFVSSVLLLDQHTNETARSINMIVCLLGAGFLFAIGRITGGGGGQSSCRDESSSFDWFKQETYRHGDLFVSSSLVLVSLLNGALPFVPGVLVVFQFLNAVLVSFWIVFFVIVVGKQKNGRQLLDQTIFVYRPCEEALHLVKEPWLR